MSEKFSQRARDDAHTANLEAISTAPSFDALRESLANSYEHHDVLRDATASLNDEIRNLERLEREEIDMELERCLIDLPHVGEPHAEVTEKHIYEDLGTNIKIRIGSLLAKDAISDEQINIALAVLEQVARDDEKATAWSVLPRLPRERLPEEAAMRILEMGATSQSVLVNERYPDYPSANYPRFLKTMEYVVGNRYGTPFHWMQGGEIVVDDRLKNIVASEHFLPVCIDSAVNRANKEKTPENRYWMQRDCEAYLLGDMLGLPEEMVTEFQAAFHPKTCLRDKDGIIPLNKGGGINQERWRRQFNRCITNLQDIGTSNARRLRQEWGIINFDRPYPEQLDRMLKLLDGDESLIEQAGTHEVTLVLENTTGDTNGAYDSDLRQIETAAAQTDDGRPTGDLVLFVESTSLPISTATL